MHSLRRLGIYSGVYNYNGAPVLKKFLEKHKNNEDLKVVLDLQRGESKTTILHEVVQFNINAADLLLDNGANPNVRDNKQKTPLHYIADDSYPGVVNLFLNKEGVDINAIDGQGKTPLHYAVYQGYQDVISNFLKKGANVITKDKSSRTALHSAVITDDLEILKMLILHEVKNSEKAYCEKPDWPDYEDEGFKVISNKRKEKTKELLAGIVDKEGNTFLHFAAKYGCGKEILKFLVENGLDINTKNNTGVMPIHIAAKCGNEEFIDFLIESNDIQCIKSEVKGWTPLNIAIRAACNKNRSEEQKKSEEEWEKSEEEWEKSEEEWKKSEEEREKEVLYRVIEKLAPFSDIEAFRPKGTFNRVLSGFKKLLTGNQDSFLVQAANQNDRIKNLLENPFRNSKEVQGTSKSVLPPDDSFYGRIGRELKEFEERSIVTKNINITRRDWEKLDKFLSKVKKAKDVTELSKIVDEALLSGVRLKFYQYNFADQVMTQIEQLNGVEQNPKIVSGMVCQLASKGVPTKGEIDEALEDLFKSHKANMENAFRKYEEHINDFRTAAAKASSNGKVNYVETDNTVFYAEYSDGSKVNVAQLMEGAKKLGLQKGDIKCSGNIIKIDDSAVEFEIEDGVRNYTDISDGGDVIITFPTRLGELEVRLHNSIKNQDLVEVEVHSSSQDIFNALSDKEKEKIGENYCLIGQHTVYEAITLGGFYRSGKSYLSSHESSEVVKKSPEGAKADSVTSESPPSSPESSQVVKKLPESAKADSVTPEKKTWAVREQKREQDREQDRKKPKVIL